MVDLEQLYYDIAGKVKGICDKAYYHDRPSSVEDRPDSYIVIALPYAINDEEMGQNGEYRDFTTTAKIEVYVRDKMSSTKPNAINLPKIGSVVKSVCEVFPVIGKQCDVIFPRITLQADDGDGFHVAVIQARLRTK